MRAKNHKNNKFKTGWKIEKMEIKEYQRELLTKIFLDIFKL